MLIGWNFRVSKKLDFTDNYLSALHTAESVHMITSFIRLYSFHCKAAKIAIILTVNIDK